MLKAKNRNYLVAFILIEILFVLSLPENRTEADDGFWFASDVRDKSFAELFNPRFPFYLPALRILLNITRVLGANIDTYYLICFFSAIFSGLTILLLYHIMVKYFDIGQKWAVIGVLFVLFSYEYWRYSMEAEVYMIATFLVLLTLRQYLKVKETNLTSDWTLLVLVSSLAVLFYKPNFIPIFICFPFIVFERTRIKHFMAFYVVSGIILLLVFFTIYTFAEVSSDSFIEYATKGAKQSPGSMVMAIVVVASNFISIQWLFSFDKIQSLIQQNMPHKAIEEELYIAEGVGTEKYVVLAFTVLFVALVLTLLFMIIKHWSGQVLTYWKKSWFLVAWVVVYGGFLAIFDPTSNEPWLMVQIPIVVLLIYLISLTAKSNYRIFVILTGLMFLINLMGGILPLKDQARDINYAKVNWLSKHSKKNDFILTYGPITLIRYLDYYTDASIVNLEEKIEEGFEVLENDQLIEENIFFTHDFTSPSKAISFRSKDQIKRMNRFMTEHNFKLDKIDSTGGFYTYRLERKTSNSID